MQIIQTGKHRQLKMRILSVATQSFLLYGIKSVKMDDIAASLKISKRTLYETYQNKEELLFDVMAGIVQERKDRIEEYARQTDDVMDLLLEFMRIQTEMVARTNPTFFSDLTRYPGLASRLDELRKQDDSLSKNFFDKGVRDGYFRSSVNYELLVNISRGIHDMLRNNKVLNLYSFHDIFQTFACSLIRGVCTEKGIKRIDSFLESYTLKDVEDRQKGKRS